MVERVYDLEEERVFLGQRPKRNPLPLVNDYVIDRKVGLRQCDAMKFAVPEGKAQFDGMRSMGFVLLIG